MSYLEAKFAGVDELNGFYDRNWEKFRKRFVSIRPELLLAQGLAKFIRRREFKSPQIEERYREKRRRVLTAINLGQPDRVPIVTSGMNFYAAHYSGVTFADYCLERKQCKRAVLKFVNDHPEFDAVYPMQLLGIGQIVKFSQTDLVRIPGLHLPDNVSYQFVEKERMPAEDYERLLNEGLRYYAAQMLPKFSPLLDFKQGVHPAPLLRVGYEFLAWQIFSSHMIDIIEKDFGMPMQNATAFVTPYDVLSSFYRGLEGLSKDLFRYPEQVEKAVRLMIAPGLKFVEFSVTLCALNSASIMCERAFTLSPRQFKRFYLPALKAVVAELVDNGIMPHIYLEGNATQCLEYFRELPPQKCVCHIDQSDIFKAKKILEGHMCVAGNVPMGILVTGSTDEVKEYCRRLLGEAAPGGGYLMCGALGIPDNAKPENIRAMIEYTLEHGKY